MFKFNPDRSADRRRMIGGSLAIMLAALLWSIDGLFIRPKFYVLPAALVVFWEHFLGFIVLSPFVYIYWPKIKSLSRRSWAAVVWISLFGGLIGTIMITKAFFAAIDGQITFATVVILQKLQPIFALLLARIILKERLSREFYVWAIVALVASYFLAFGASGLDPRTINWTHSAAVWAGLAAFSFGSATVFGKRLANHLDYKATAALRFGTTTILALILIVINGTIFKVGQMTALHFELLGLIVLTSGAGAMFIYYFGLRRVPASAATILELFWPFSALLLDYLFNKNYLSGPQILAVLVLLLALYRVVAAGRLRAVEFSARVIHGHGRGQKSGYPTANLDTTEVDIPHGVYIVEATVRGQTYAGLMHFGFKDVFNEPVSLEVLLQGFSGDIYDEEMKVKVIRLIREVKNFPSPELLAEEIRRDLAALEGYRVA